QAPTIIHPAKPINIFYEKIISVDIVTNIGIETDIGKISIDHQSTKAARIISTDIPIRRIGNFERLDRIRGSSLPNKCSDRSRLNPEMNWMSRSATYSIDIKHPNRRTSPRVGVVTRLHYQAVIRLQGNIARHSGVAKTPIVFRACVGT